MSDGDLLDLTPQQLTGMFQQGRRWLYEEGMRTDGGGAIRRVRQVWHLVESTLTHDVYLNAYMLQVELPDDWDQALGPDMERDALSGLYGRDAIERYADKVFSCPAAVLRGLAIFQINGLAGQGEEAQKDLLYALGALLSMALGGDCVLGQYGIERIIVLFPSLASRDELKHRMEEAFSMIRRVLRSGTVEKYDLDATASRRIAELEREFSVSQSDLRSTIQRLETVNGELQAANEELLTANEELQSVNEELYTVNTEHQLKLDELTMMTNDLSNFLSSTMIGILFVDSNLNIRKFTEYVGREFQLMDHDIGRSIQIFAHSFPDEAIEDDCRTVLRDLVSIDREVTAMNGRFYTLRIAPYRTTENSIRGLVITIIDSLGKPQGGAGAREDEQAK